MANISFFFFSSRGNAPYRDVHEEAEIILALLYKPTDNSSSVTSMGSDGVEGGSIPPPHASSDGALRSISSDGSTASSQFIREKTDHRGEVKAVGYDPTVSTPNTPGVGPTGFGNYNPNVPQGEETVTDLSAKLLALAGHEIKRGATKAGSVVKAKANEYDSYGVLSYVGLGSSDPSGQGYQKSSGDPIQGGGAPVGWGSNGGGGPSGGVVTAQGGGSTSTYSTYYKPQQAPAPPSRVAPGSAAPESPARKEPSGKNKRTPPALLTPTISADSNASTEEKLVKDLTAPGGVVKTTLPPGILVSFSDRFPDLDQQLVVRLVFQRLKAPQWQIRLKGLLVLEEIVKLAEDLEVFFSFFIFSFFFSFLFFLSSPPFSFFSFFFSFSFLPCTHTKKKPRQRATSTQPLQPLPPSVIYSKPHTDQFVPKPTLYSFNYKKKHVHFPSSLKSLRKKVRVKKRWRSLALVWRREWV